MTPVEQDVYALMGVSPLVRLDREFKDPKSVIVTVRSPGEPEVFPDLSEKTDPSLRKETPTKSNALADLEALANLTDTNGNDNEKSRSSAIAEDSPNFFNLGQKTTSAKLVLPDINPSVAETEPTQGIEEESKEETDPPLIRRRRRRSSAQEV